MKPVWRECVWALPPALRRRKLLNAFVIDGGTVDARQPAELVTVNWNV